MEKSTSPIGYMPCPQDAPSSEVSPPDLAPPPYTASPQCAPTPYPVQPAVPVYVLPQPTPVQQVQSTTVVHAVLPVGNIRYGPKQQRTTCPHCNNNVITRTESKVTSKTHLWAFCLCICGLWPCCFIPYCMDSCMNKNHYCPNCNTFLGTYQS